jgi:hypothetical protein
MVGKLSLVVGTTLASLAMPTLAWACSPPQKPDLQYVRSIRVQTELVSDRSSPMLCRPGNSCATSVHAAATKLARVILDTAIEQPAGEPNDRYIGRVEQLIVRDPQGAEVSYGNGSILIEQGTACVRTGLKPEGDAGVVETSELCTPFTIDLAISPAELTQYESDSRRWCADGGIPVDSPGQEDSGSSLGGSSGGGGCSQTASAPAPIAGLLIGVCALLTRKKRIPITKDDPKRSP